MTTAIKDAMKKADVAYWRFDRNRDNAARQQYILRLSAEGLTDNDIAIATGISVRHVKRVRTGVSTAVKPCTPTAPDVSDQHCADLEEMADIAINLACRLRDDDPQIIWDTLTGITRQQLQELTVILLAAIPTDFTKKQLFGWVYDLAQTQEN